MFYREETMECRIREESGCVAADETPATMIPRGAGAQRCLLPVIEQCESPVKR